jgi:hypothetical protein
MAIGAEGEEMMAILIRLAGYFAAVAAFAL